MKCPHCLINFKDNLTTRHLGSSKDGNWTIQYENCLECDNLILFLNNYRDGNNILLYPKSIYRASLSSDIPNELANDYKEACLVIQYSPKASAALSRRCLQHILQEKANVKKADLSKQIAEVLASKQLPNYLAEGIDAVRNIGNLAAHPIKDRNTGEIVEVEPGEAEWLLEILEQLFEFYFIEPAILQRKKDKLNKKLADLGKPPMQ
ncbi:MAG: DUF4145 domain-containing protein [Nostocaceae cyanobacterium]|nr:DUF4145 domain-containing protein [Nostocaceae cyanobacterium]